VYQCSVVSVRCCFPLSWSCLHRPLPPSHIFHHSCSLLHCLRAATFFCSVVVSQRRRSFSTLHRPPPPLHIVLHRSFMETSSTAAWGNKYYSPLLPISFSYFISLFRLSLFRLSICLDLSISSSSIPISLSFSFHLLFRSIFAFDFTLISFLFLILSLRAILPSNRAIQSECVQICHCVQFSCSSFRAFNRSAFNFCAFNRSAFNFCSSGTFFNYQFQSLFCIIDEVCSFLFSNYHHLQLLFCYSTFHICFFMILYSIAKLWAKHSRTWRKLKKFFLLCHFFVQLFFHLQS